MPSHLKHSHQMAKTLGPVLTALAMTAFLAACTGTAPSVDSGDQMSSSAASSVPDTTMDASSSSSSSSSSASADVGATGLYKDGTYDAMGSYVSPAGPESVNISLTLEDGVIVNATFQGNATASRSQVMQSQFSAGFKEAVIGKSINDLSLTVVNGSSLTPKGFMEAVKKIQAEASVS